MTRRSRFSIAGGLLVVALTVGALLFLPVVVRWLAVSRISDLTGRDASIADVDLNLFTRRLAVDRFVLAGATRQEPPGSCQRF